MEEERLPCFNPMNKICNQCQQHHIQDIYIYPFPGLPFGFENLLDEDDLIKDERTHKYKYSNHYDSENVDEVDTTDNASRTIYKVDEILYKIEHTTPMILKNLTMSGIPYKYALNIIRQIIYLTLTHSQKSAK